MATIKKDIDYFAVKKNIEIVAWDPKYVTGIQLIDLQHRELVSLTNELYHACRAGKEASGNVFRDAMSRMVEYVRFHFGAEEKILQRVKYPQYDRHKKLHEELVRSILEAAKEFNEGKKFVPNQFVRTLKDWIFGHIGIEDKQYAAYIFELKRKGLLTDESINAG